MPAAFMLPFMQAKHDAAQVPQCSCAIKNFCIA
jgi:hypothetical protein